MNVIIWKFYNLHAKGRCMGKTLYDKYLDDVINRGVYLPVFILHQIWIFISYPFQAVFFITFHMEVKGELRTI